jgi:hypothetical protein
MMDWTDGFHRFAASHNLLREAGSAVAVKPVWTRFVMTILGIHGDITGWPPGDQVQIIAQPIEFYALSIGGYALEAMASARKTERQTTLRFLSAISAGQSIKTGSRIDGKFYCQGLTTFTQLRCQ